MPREILPRPVSERDVSILIASGKQSQIMATMECITLWFLYFIHQVSWPHVCLLAALVAVLMGFASPLLLIFLINGAGDYATVATLTTAVPTHGSLSDFYCMYFENSQTCNVWLTSS